MTACRKTLVPFFKCRSIRLTPEGRRYAFLTLGVGVAAINTGQNLLYLLFAMMLSLIVVSGFVSEQCLKHLEVQRRLPVEMFACHPATAMLVVRNRKYWTGAFSLHINDVAASTDLDKPGVFHLSPGAMVSLSYPLLFARRGRYRLDAVKLLTRFPFGLFAKAITLPLEQEVIVYPEIKALPQSWMRTFKASGRGQVASRRGQGGGLYNLRPYQPGDDSRTIHWKTTARDSRLMVRETEAEDQLRVTIVLLTQLPDLPVQSRLSSPADQFERSVCLAASLAAYFCRSGYEVQLMTGRQAVPYGRGEAHLSRILRLLALCDSATGLRLTPDQEEESVRGFVAGDHGLVMVVAASPSRVNRYRGLGYILAATDFPDLL